MQRCDEGHIPATQGGGSASVSTVQIESCNSLGRANFAKWLMANGGSQPKPAANLRLRVYIVQVDANSGYRSRDLAICMARWSEFGFAGKALGGSTRLVGKLPKRL